MASRQQLKEERAEAGAKLAARDMGDINRANEREEGYDLHSEANFKQARAEAAAKLAAKDLEDANRLRESSYSYKEHDENKPSMIGSMFRAAKEAVVGKPHHTDTETNADSGGSKMADYANHKAKEAKDATMQKAGEYTDYASQKAKEAKDVTVQKAGEYKDYTAEKAKEGRDSAAGKLGEFKDRAMGFFTGNNKEDEETRRTTQQLRVHDKGPGGEKLVIKMEESRPGAVADALKAADKAFAGDMHEEGVLHVERRREKM